MPDPTKTIDTINKTVPPNRTKTITTKNDSTRAAAPNVLKLVATPIEANAAMKAAPEMPTEADAAMNAAPGMLIKADAMMNATPDMPTEANSKMNSAPDMPTEADAAMNAASKMPMEADVAINDAPDMPIEANAVINAASDMPTEINAVIKVAPAGEDDTPMEAHNVNYDMMKNAAPPAEECTTTDAANPAVLQHVTTTDVTAPAIAATVDDNNMVTNATSLMDAAAPANAVPAKAQGVTQEVTNILSRPPEKTPDIPPPIPSDSALAANDVAKSDGDKTTYSHPRNNDITNDKNDTDALANKNLCLLMIILQVLALAPLRVITMMTRTS